MPETEGWKFEFSKTGLSAIPCFILGLACCVIPIVFIVFLAIYGFNNPDNEAWIGKDRGGDIHLYENKIEVEMDGASDVVNIHTRFGAWFIWGFIMHCITPTLALGVVGCSVLCCSPVMISVITCILASLASAAGMAWWITGIVWRFNDYGRYASGDIVPEDIEPDQWKADIEQDPDSLYQH